ncbi:unnamed protein product, partial [Mesorhabditis spiculigera]
MVFYYGIVALIFSSHFFASTTARLAGFRGPLTIARDEDGFIESTDLRFDYLMLTLIYPVAVCRADDDAVKDSCEVPDGTPSWTVHGLWPNYANGSYPQFCTRQKFDIDLVSPIFEELKKDWPNLYPNRQVSSLWKHEYEKHGTCASSDPILESELKYFQSTLKLHERFDVAGALSGEGVKPAETKQELLGDVRLCLDLNLELIDCPKHAKAVSASPHLPDFRPCTNSIIYLPNTPKAMLEQQDQYVEASLMLFPASTFFALLRPLEFLILAVIFLFVLLISLCKLHLEWIRERQLMNDKNNNRMGGG